MEELYKYRRQIDKIDEDLVELLKERFRITDEVGKIKKEADLPAEDSTRERDQEEKLEKLAREKEVDVHLVKNVFRLIRSSVKKRHRSFRSSAPEENE